ncbi:MAG: hypothetical protein OXL96_13835 [Candidatus Poribacteria bacterium]|nr:hypothetical protein [Candidatus Poribacteria bacterium]
MKSLNYVIDTRNNQLKHIPGHASEIKTDAEYLEASKSAMADIEAIGEQLEAWADDFDIRVAYNKLVEAHQHLKVKTHRRRN